MTTKEFVFSNGDKVVETITGFTGTITGTCFYITGCSQYLVTAKSKNKHSAAKALWYDESRLVLLDGVEPDIEPEEELIDDGDGYDIAPPIGKRGR